MSERTPIESANLARVEEALSLCLEQGRSLTRGLVLELHRILMEGVSEEPKRPTKPGRFRDATDEVWAAGVKHLSKHMTPAWRIESDVVSLLEDAEGGKLHPDNMFAAGRLHYRFVRIHPFCDGNGRMARALSTFLLAREHSEILHFETPVSRVILDHREDYIGVLEYCDMIYEGLGETDIAEEKRLEWAERPFSDFHARAFLRAYREHNRRQHQKLEAMGLSVPPFPPSPPGLYALDLETMKKAHPWNETMKKAAVFLSRATD